MLPLLVVKQVRQLLDEGELSQRKIAQQLGVSRGTVNAIANGHRGLHGRESPSHVPSVAHVQLVAERCRGCGGMVYKPCRLCQIRRIQRRQGLPASRHARSPSRRVA